jgi:hypothetical protein
VQRDRLGHRTDLRQLPRVDHCEPDINIAVDGFHLDVDWDLTESVHVVDNLIEHCDEQVLVAIRRHATSTTALSVDRRRVEEGLDGAEHCFRDTLLTGRSPCLDTHVRGMGHGPVPGSRLVHLALPMLTDPSSTASRLDSEGSNPSTWP